MIESLRVSRRAAIAAIAGLALLPGLADSARAAAFSLPDYSGRPPLRLAVDRVDVEVQYQPPRQLPYVEENLIVKPVEGLRRWSEQRLQPAGSDPGTPGRRAVVVIKEASMRQEMLATSGGIRSWFTREQAERNTLRLSVGVEIRDAGGALVSRVETYAERSSTLPEKASQAQREVQWHQLLLEALGDVDTGLTGGINDNMRNFLR